MESIFTILSSKNIPVWTHMKNAFVSSIRADKPSLNVHSVVLKYYSDSWFLKCQTKNSRRIFLALVKRQNLQVISRKPDILMVFWWLVVRFFLRS